MENWISFIYLYSVGGLLFWGIILFALRKKVLHWHNRSDRYLLICCGLCYVMYFLFQGTWNYLAIASGS